jgi:hypothetical protein
MIYEPEPGDWRILLDLADDPRHDVATTTDTPQLGVVIPEELYRRLLTYKSLSDSSSPKEPKKKEKP